MTKKHSLTVFVNGGPNGAGAALTYKLFLKNGFKAAEAPGLADVIVFTGGADVSPTLYGQPAHSKTNISPLRDRYDTGIFLMNPGVLKVGICRGGQFLNVMSGGSMIQHINGAYHLGSHSIYTTRKGSESIITGVTSTHHQMMLPSNSTRREILCTAYRGDKKHALGPMTLCTSPSEKELPIQMNPTRAGFFGSYKQADFDPRRDDLEGVYYPDTGSLCIQGHPEYPEASTGFKEWFFSMVFEKHDENQAFLDEKIEHLEFNRAI